MWFWGGYRYQINRQGVANMFTESERRRSVEMDLPPRRWPERSPNGAGRVDDGTWKDGQLRLTWQPTPRNKITAWSQAQYICLHCIQGGDSNGLTFGGIIATPEAIPRNENHPNLMTQLVLVLAGHFPPDPRRQRPVRAVFLLGEPAEGSVRCDADSGAG